MSGDLLTSTSWEWADAAGTTTPIGLTWAAATTYGYNGQAGLIWTTNHGGPISGISTGAQWIWNESNFATGTNSDIYLRAEINVVPEPGTMILLGLGLAGLALVPRRRK